MLKCPLCNSDVDVVVIADTIAIIDGLARHRVTMKLSSKNMPVDKIGLLGSAILNLVLFS